MVIRDSLFYYMDEVLVGFALHLTMVQSYMALLIMGHGSFLRDTFPNRQQQSIIICSATLIQPDV